MLDTVVERSEGVFLYAEWVREEMAQGRLSLDRLEQVPQKLGGVYAQFFERQFPDVRGYEERVRPGLDLMAVAREPLAVGDLAALLGWGERQRTTWVRSLGSLFPVGRDGKIQVFHQSVMDWLTSEEKAGPYWVSVADSEQELIERCLGLYRKGVRPLPGYVLRHLPRHLLAARRLDEVVTLLMDWRFLEAKAEAGLVFELADDFAATVKALPAGKQRRTLELLEEGLRRDIQFLARHPSMLFQCLWNSAWWYDCPEAAGYYVEERSPGQEAGLGLHRLLEGWRAAKEQQSSGLVWLRSLRPPTMHLGGAQRAVFRGHEDSVKSVAFSPDGRRVLSGSEDKTVRVWDSASGQQLLCLTGHEHPVYSVAFSPDGRRFLSGSQDKTVRVWDALSGECLEVFPGQTDVAALAGGAMPLLWRAVTHDLETVIESTANGQPIALFSQSVRGIASHPSGGTWAGGIGVYLCLFTLQGRPPG